MAASFLAELCNQALNIGDAPAGYAWGNFNGSGVAAGFYPSPPTATGDWN